MSEDPGPKPTKCEKPHTQPDVTHWEPLDPEAHEQALQIGATGIGSAIFKARPQILATCDSFVCLLLGY